MLNDIIKSLGIFPVDEIPDIVSLFSKKEFKLNEFLVSEGNEFTNLVFIESGAFHLYRKVNDDLITIRFACKGSFISSYSSLITIKESPVSIQCVSDAKVWFIDNNTVARLASSSLPWSKFLGFTAQIQYLELEKYALEKHTSNAKTRYEKILKEHPECILETPLKHLASYLGVSPRHLSRIRKD